jgi:hypothetical protein
MTAFEAKQHIIINENYQGINLTEFTLKVDEQMDNDKIVDTFIQSRQFSSDNLQDHTKAKPYKCYLDYVFDIKKITISDFKKTNKQGVSKFLFDFINEPDWGDDRNEFAKLLDKYFEIHNIFADCDFYIISKDWFKKDNEKVIETANWIYIYYFLIISIDRKLNLLRLSEWIYD